MDGCFRLGESLELCILIFYLLPTNCFYSFFMWVRFCVCFVYNCLCAVCHGTKKCGLLSANLFVSINIYFLILFSIFIIGSYLFFF